MSAMKKITCVNYIESKQHRHQNKMLAYDQVTLSFFYWNKQSIMLRSQVLHQTVNANQKQMCMKYTLLINTHLCTELWTGRTNMHTVTFVVDNQRMQKTHLMYILTYTETQPTNLPRSVAQAKTINMNSSLSLSPSLSVHKKTACTPMWPQSAHGNVEVGGGCHYAKFGRPRIHSLQEKGNINMII